MAGYVLGTWFIQILVAISAAYAVSAVSTECVVTTTNSTTGTTTTEDDENKSNIMIFCLLMIICGFVHACFAYYLQRRLVSMISDESNDMGPDKKPMKVSTALWEILKRDFGFCFYFFFFFGALAISWWGFANVSSSNSCGDKVKQGSGGAVALAFLYGVIAPCYGCMFLCGKATTETASSARGRLQEAKKKREVGAGQPAPDTVESTGA